MPKPLDELYFIWLYRQVADPNVKRPSYWNLLRQFFTKEFVWIVPNDDNRMEDGRDLRYEFAEDQGIQDVDPDWLRFGCSMLELMVGLSRRLAFEAEGEPAAWFWELVGNLELAEYNDEFNPYEGLVEMILDRVIWRNYERNGRGGFFPLKKAGRDQRKVEMWYQLSAYVLERSA